MFAITQTLSILRGLRAENRHVMHAGSSSSPSKLLDLDRLREIFGSDSAMQNTLKSFLSRVPKTSKSLQEAGKSRNFVKLRRDANSLKGACGYVASDQLQASALRLELAADAAERGEENDTLVETCLQDVLQLLAALCTTIEKAVADVSDNASVDLASLPDHTAPTEPPAPAQRPPFIPQTTPPSVGAAAASSSSSVAEAEAASSDQHQQVIDPQKMRDSREHPLHRHLYLCSQLPSTSLFPPS